LDSKKNLKLKEYTSILKLDFSQNRIFLHQFFTPRTFLHHFLAIFWKNFQQKLCFFTPIFPPNCEIEKIFWRKKWCKKGKKLV